MTTEALKPQNSVKLITQSTFFFNQADFNLTPDLTWFLALQFRLLRAFSIS